MDAPSRIQTDGSKPYIMSGIDRRTYNSVNGLSAPYHPEFSSRAQIIKIDNVDFLMSKKIRGLILEIT